MMSELLDADRCEGALDVLTLNRPPANSYNMEFI